ncbi:MAG: hypothetical protein HOC28_01950 [Bacteroidetes Order II. Incertae sedis bacterium]|jgi:hypothetical protein|nr:hypothetical protein [Bacteroidetes Order II. bacterium]MBT5250382.1 hypothetical protein [Bacteroidetes Order II. bacterium]MBT6424709.1 hypothetical protein [Bacteroidetes Order II. bacterium]
MPCFFVAGALLLPRLTIAYLWLMTNWFSGVFPSLLWPILGFMFAPATLLWYTVVDQIYAGSWGTFQIAVLIIAILVDVSPSTKKKKKKKSAF